MQYFCKVVWFTLSGTANSTNKKCCSENHMQFMKYLSMILMCESSVQAVSPKVTETMCFEKIIHSYSYILLILTPLFKKITAKHKNVINIKFTLEQATKAQKRSRGISLLFL